MNTAKRNAPLHVACLLLLFLGSSATHASSIFSGKLGKIYSLKTHASGRRVQGTGIAKIAVVGERHSGTNYMKKTLEMNVKANIEDHFCQFKHDYQAPSEDCPSLEDTLVIVMLRNPYDWALAMHRYCWCGGPEIAAVKAALSFKDFLSQPFVESSLKPWTTERQKSPCGNVMQCRALKYLNFLNISSWAPNVEFVRHEDIITPERTQRWLSDIMARYRLEQITDNLQTVSAYKGYHGFSFDFHTAMRKSIWFSPELPANNQTIQYQVDLITKMMDAEVERMVGYGPLRAGPSQAVKAAVDRLMKSRTMPS